MSIAGGRNPLGGACMAQAYAEHAGAALCLMEKSACGLCMRQKDSQGAGSRRVEQAR
jgi:hypothetical protein